MCCLSIPGANHAAETNDVKSHHSSIGKDNVSLSVALFSRREKLVCMFWTNSEEQEKIYAEHEKNSFIPHTLSPNKLSVKNSDNISITLSLPECQTVNQTLHLHGDICKRLPVDDVTRFGSWGLHFLVCSSQKELVEKIVNLVFSVQIQNCASQSIPVRLECTDEKERKQESSALNHPLAQVSVSTHQAEGCAFGHYFEKGGTANTTKTDVSENVSAPSK